MSPQMCLVTDKLPRIKFASIIRLSQNFQRRYCKELEKSFHFLKKGVNVTINRYSIKVLN